MDTVSNLVLGPTGEDRIYKRTGVFDTIKEFGPSWGGVLLR